MTLLARLFEPLKIGSMTLKNRIVMTPLTTLYDFEGGPRYNEFFAERARGGAAMITINLQALYPGRTGKSGWVPDESVWEKGHITINHDLYIPRLQSFTRAVHDAGARACVQLSVYGNWARGGYGAPAEEYSPSGVRLSGEAYRPDLESLSFIKGGRVLAVEEIRMIEEQVAEAAARAVNAGFDAVQLQALGGNLLSRFLSPLTNRRDDEYGGSLENRARIVTETLRAIRRRVGDDFPLLCRINGDDLMPGGMGVSDYGQLAPLLEDAGVDALDLMPGWYETRRPVNQMCVPRGAFVYAAEGVKQAARVPVSANIRITDPLLAEQILQEGKADWIAVCSALIADPEWPRKAQEGRLEDIRLCTACCGCWSDLAGHRRPIACSVNARAGMEHEYVLRPAGKARTIWVVGGGPAGMEAARVASARGHRVTLFERRDRVGGQLIFADLPPHKGEWQHFIRYLQTQILKNGVLLKLNTKVTADGIVAGRPDDVILATGARPLVPDIPGIEGPHVCSCVDVLSGKKEVGPCVAIIGGGCIGSETAEFLHARGKQVNIIEMLPRVAADVDFWNRWVLLDRLDAAGIRIITGAQARKITADGIHIVRDGSEEFVQCDSVIYSVGARPYHPLLEELAGRFERVHCIGDCREPQRVRQAVAAGFQIGLAV
ncbi:MAG: FAD-dependent oxidoreductase [Acidobacteria bacterium]|nr:FAD-dependent oxidoreductase [Acidobacteriota bacterium]